MSRQDYPPHPTRPALLGMRYKRKSGKPITIESWSYWHTPPTYCRNCTEHDPHVVDRAEWHYEGASGGYFYNQATGNWFQSNTGDKRFLGGGAPWRVRLI